MTLALAALGLLLAMVIAAVALAHRGERLQDRRQSGPRVPAGPLLPADVTVFRRRVEEAELLVLERGPQGPDTPSILHVPGFAEDVRHGLLSLRDWIDRTPCFRVQILNKRGYAPPFFEQDIAVRDAPFRVTVPAGYPIEGDAAIVRELTAADPSGAIILWGHSQGGATVQQALTELVGPDEFVLREDLAARVRAMVLEAAVLPGGGLDWRIDVPRSRLLMRMGLDLVPLADKFDGVVLASVRRRLRALDRPDREHRIEALRQCLFRFRKPRVAIDNGWSLLTFMKERGRVGVLERLHAMGKLRGLFPTRRDLVLGTRRNLAIIRGIMGPTEESDEVRGPLVTPNQSHFIGLERPDLCADLLDALLREPSSSGEPSGVSEPLGRSESGRGVSSC